MRESLRADLSRVSGSDPSFVLAIKLFFTHAPFSAVVLARMAGAAHRRLPALGRVIARTNQVLHGADIDPRAVLGSGLLLQHPVGVVIGAGAVLGHRVSLMSGVVLGRRDVQRGPDAGMYPSVGNDVLIGAHAVILGPISVGDAAVIGAQAVVLHDVPAGSTAFGIPASSAVARE